MCVLVRRSLEVLSREVPPEFRGRAKSKQNRFWGTNWRKWQDQLVINHFPRLGLLPSYSFPVDNVQLEVLQGGQAKQIAFRGKRTYSLYGTRVGESVSTPRSPSRRAGRIWQSYGIGRYPRHFMPTRYYRECAHCRHVEVNEEKESVWSGLPLVQRKVNRNSKGIHRTKELCHVSYPTEWRRSGPDAASATAGPGSPPAHIRSRCGISCQSY